MSKPTFTRIREQKPPDPQGSGGDAGSDATDAIWQYLRRIEDGLDQIDARIDRLYIALGGGTVLLSAIGLTSAFIIRGG